MGRERREPRCRTASVARASSSGRAAVERLVRVVHVGEEGVTDS
jgi:hypothetical protein